MSKEKDDSKLIITLFEPTERDMRLDYPEFNEIDEFKDLSPRKLKFCWYVGNRTSPLASLAPKQRVIEATKIAFEGYARDKDLQKQLNTGEIPKELKDAITRMAAFIPTVRLRAKLDTEYIFEAMQSLIFVTPDEKKGMDSEAKKEYQALLSKISKDLPDLVNKIENGFGVKVVKENNRKAEVKVSISDLLNEID